MTDAPHDCPCPHHPFDCYGHPHDCGCSRAGEPFIEFGAGWAKIHFRRDVTEQDRANLTAALALSSNNSPGES